jgi:hypothetical protein
MEHIRKFIKHAAFIRAFMISRNSDNMGFLAEKKLKCYHVLPITVIGAVVILINGWVLYQVIELGNSSIFDENDLVEN